MTGVELFLLLAGCIFMAGSFFITEKLSPAELNKIAELSEAEIRNIIDSGLENASVKIEDAIGEQIGISIEEVERALEKETNEKIMAINEYSDTVIENMNKTHNEIVFLYSMLNDKHSELTGLATDLQKIATNVKAMQEKVKKPVDTTHITRKQPMPVMKTQAGSIVQPAQPVKAVENPEEKENHNEEILELHKKGLSGVEIAKKLGVGLGEVKLVIGLYKGDKRS